jgi:hypothetical protein
MVRNFERASEMIGLIKDFLAWALPSEGIPWWAVLLISMLPAMPLACLWVNFMMKVQKAWLMFPGVFLCAGVFCGCLVLLGPHIYTEPRLRLVETGTIELTVKVSCLRAESGVGSRETSDKLWSNYVIYPGELEELRKNALEVLTYFNCPGGKEDTAVLFLIK